MQTNSADPNVSLRTHIEEAILEVCEDHGRALPHECSDEECNNCGACEVEEFPHNITVPDGWLLYIDCNHPGTVYVGDQDNWDWLVFNGCAPAKVTREQAWSFMTKGDECCGKWNLEVQGALPFWARQEMTVVEDDLDFSELEALCDAPTKPVKIKEKKAEVVGIPVDSQEDGIPIFFYDEVRDGREDG